MVNACWSKARERARGRAGRHGVRLWRFINVASAAALKSATQSAASGDTLRLAGGDYGDLTIMSKAFIGAGLTIASANPDRPAVFNSLNVIASSGIHFVGVDVDYTATASTYAFSSVVDILRSKDISFVGGRVNATSATNGVPDDANELDATGNVIGLQTGRGFTIEDSSGVTVQRTEIRHVAKGVVMSDSDHVTLRGNEISDVRTSPIVGGGLSYIVIDGNHLSNATPWGWGGKDHADFIHLWTSRDSTEPSVGIEIINNTIDQDDGVAILGINIEDNSGLGFDGIRIADNLILLGNSQGVRLEHVFNAVVKGNVLAAAGDKAPGILVTHGSYDVEVTGNLAGFVSTAFDGTGDLHDNVIIQDDDRSAGQYYDPSILTHLAGMSSAEAFRYLSHLIDIATPFVPTARQITDLAVATLDSDIGQRDLSQGAPEPAIGGGTR